MQKHPSILPNDFDISPATGQLVLNVPPETNQLIIGKDSDAYEPSSDLEHTFEFECRTQTSIQNDLISSSKDSVIQEPDYVNISSKVTIVVFLFFLLNFNNYLTIYFSYQNCLILHIHYQQLLQTIMQKNFVKQWPNQLPDAKLLLFNFIKLMEVVLVLVLLD